MRFFSEDQARTWAARFARVDDARGRPVVPAPDHKGRLRFSFEERPGHTYFYLAQEVVRSLEYFDECLLWVTEVGVWPSNENLHLYYRLRQSYGDQLLVQERPGILALRHEHVDLTSFVHLGMLFGWDMYLVTSHDYGRVFVCHDGFVEFSEATPNVAVSLIRSKSA